MESNEEQIEEELIAMHLSGTVSIPPKFPTLADLMFSVYRTGEHDVLRVSAAQRISPKVKITRTFFIEDVAAIFYPSELAIAKHEPVCFTKGEWKVGEQVRIEALNNYEDDECVVGILFVKEAASSLLEVSAGLTAAESAEYYPPLPTDRSQNHYNFSSGTPGCPWDGESDGIV